MSRWRIESMMVFTIISVGASRGSVANPAVPKSVVTLAEDNKATETKTDAVCGPTAFNAELNTEAYLRNRGTCPLSFVFKTKFDQSVFGKEVAAKLVGASVVVSPDRIFEHGVLVYTTDDPKTGACLQEDHCFAAVPLDSATVPDSHFVIAQARVQAGAYDHATLTNAIQVREARWSLLRVSAGAVLGFYQSKGETHFAPTPFVYGGVSGAYGGYWPNKLLPRSLGVIYAPSVFSSNQLSGLARVGGAVTLFDHHLIVGLLKDFNIDHGVFVVGWNVSVDSFGSFDGPF